MIAVVCDFCSTELDQPGGLIFSPPFDRAWTVVKRHICVDCYPRLTVRVPTHSESTDSATPRPASAG